MTHMSWRCASISDAGLEEERTHSLSLFQAPMPTTLSAAHSVPHVSTTAVAQICASGCDFSTASLEIVQSNKTAVLDHDLDHPWQWSEETPNAVHTSVDGEQALFEPFIKVTAETHDTLPIIEDTMLQEYHTTYHEDPPSETHDGVPLSPTLIAPVDQDGTHHSDVLLYYSRNPVNLVLDSTMPEIAPHIVISPPEFEWDEYLVPSQNSVEYQMQVPELLVVPLPTRPFTALDARPPDNSDGDNEPPLVNLSQTSSPVPIPSSEDDSSADRARKRRKPNSFSRGHFSQLVEFSAWERRSYPDVLTAVHRRLYRLNAAYAALHKAPSLHAIYNTPGWHCAAEHPFKWTDPAHALLSHLRHFRGTLILDSARPCSAPHIVINAAAPPNPWIRWGNVPNAQDAAWGAALTVPWAPAANVPGSVGEEYVYIAESTDVSQSYAENESAVDAVVDHSARADADNEDDDEGVHMTEYYTHTDWGQSSSPLKGGTPDDPPEDVVTVEVLEVGASDSEQEGEAEADPEADSSSCDSRPETPGPGTPLDPPVALPLGLVLGIRKEGTTATGDVPERALFREAVKRRTASA